MTEPRPRVWLYQLENRTRGDFHIFPSARSLATARRARRLGAAADLAHWDESDRLELQCLGNVARTYARRVLLRYARRLRLAGLVVSVGRYAKPK